MCCNCNLLPLIGHYTNKPSLKNDVNKFLKEHIFVYESDKTLLDCINNLYEILSIEDAGSRGYFDQNGNHCSCSNMTDARKHPRYCVRFTHKNSGVADFRLFLFN